MPAWLCGLQEMKVVMESTMAMIRWTRNRDNSRLIHCEDASRKQQIHNADVYSRMYITFEELEKAAVTEDIWYASIFM